MSVAIWFRYVRHNYNSTNDMLGATQMKDGKKKLKNICRMDYPRNKTADSPKFCSPSVRVWKHILSQKIQRTLDSRKIGGGIFVPTWEELREDLAVQTIYVPSV
jgi:hypothetical protein